LCSAAFSARFSGGLLRRGRTLFRFEQEAFIMRIIELAAFGAAVVVASMLVIATITVA
jgi:hypothetical protein